MTIYSGIFNSVNGDRKYNAWWFAKYFATFIGNGVFPNPSSNLQIAAYQNMKVVVKPGSGWIDGYFIYSDGDHVLSLDVADGVLKRIDRVVMRLNHLTRKIEIVVKKGTFASSPAAPTLQRDADAYELALADVLINNGATQITQANITDQRLNSTLCGIVHGTVNQVDTTTIFNQYQAWFAQTTQNVAIDLDIWKQHTKDDFDAWFDSIKGILDGDVAGNLAAHIAQLEVDFSNHDKDVIRHNNYGRATGTNALIITSVGSSKPIMAYTEGMSYKFKNTTTNTSGTMTVNIDGVGVKNLRRNGNLALPVGAIKAGGIYNISYDGSVFTLTDEGGEYGDAIAGDVRKGKTIGTINGLVTGTLDLSNLKPENIRRGVTIDGITGGIDKAHGKLVTEEDANLCSTYSIYEDNRNNRKVFPIDDGEKYEFTSWGTAHTVKKFNAAGVVTQTVPIPYGGEAYWFDIVKFGEVQCSRQFYSTNAYNWDTGVLIHQLMTTSFGLPYVSVKTPATPYDRLLIGITGTANNVGVYNSSMVWLAGISWCESIDNGYGFVRQLADTAVIVNGKGASCVLMINGLGSQTIRTVYFNTHENASSMTGRCAQMLITLGRKI
ncbi:MULTISPECIES: hypothetical protein [unclassified Lysinibacillus]|uniref:hypothetical protein n=1 Tax=unclassified Lysinibacillus TaxID=2636778 RepID=UPI000881239E|nr:MULTISPECIES: hypothetical protein [unclassified Lysinibacillus]SCY98899.1 hypothetical protein SAMN02787078_03430 [Lysinibacillus sp. SG9]SDB47186.1 hypothetical protein SAMN02787079_03633 [Lysinibacillus sp. TC-37]SFT12208.1 hypothetical protein SAMN02787087_03732 [Lysinibacillus sp. SG55]